MNFKEFKEAYEDKMKESDIHTDDEELMKLFMSHVIVAEKQKESWEREKRLDKMRDKDI